MAARGIASSLSRTAVAIAALMIAVATSIGVGLTIGSFREAVVRWLEGTLRADVYIAPPSLIGSRPDATLDRGLVARLADTPGVAGSSTSRAVVAPSREAPSSVIALGLGRGRRPGFRFLGGVDPERAWADFDAGAVLVSEPFAYRRGIGSGRPRAPAHRPRRARLPRGRRLLRLRLERGRGIHEPARRTSAHWDDRAVAGLALEAVPGADVDALVERLRAARRRERAGGGRSARTAASATPRSSSSTGRSPSPSVLRILTLAVAFIGVLSALLALQLERGARGRRAPRPRA